MVEIDEVHCEAVTTQRKDGKRTLQFFDELGAIGQAGERVVKREEADAPIRLLLFLGSTVPSDSRDPDGAANEQAQGNLGGLFTIMRNWH
jgi:hypothetical protein